MIHEPQQALLSRIFRSRHFRKAPALRQVLSYICERTANFDGAPLKEYEIATNALGRRASFDPRIDPIVRVNVANIRNRLRRYFEGEGKREKVHLQIPKGQYRAVFFEAGEEPQSLEKTARKSQILQWLWRPYLSGSSVNQFLFSELLFLRHENGNYIRNMYCNEVSSVEEDIARRLPEIDLEGYTPSYHFVSSGEMQCAIHLIGMFSSFGVRIEPVNSRFASWRSLTEANLVVLGSSRTNLFLDSLQSEENFLIAPREIENRSPEPGEERSYRGRREQGARLRRATEYALVTRRPGLASDQTVTIIAANNGRAIEGAGRFLTSEEKVAKFVEKLRKSSESEAPPPFFQLLLQVDLVDYADEVVRVEYVTHRVIES